MALCLHRARGGGGKGGADWFRAAPGGALGTVRTREGNGRRRRVVPWERAITEVDGTVGCVRAVVLEEAGGAVKGARPGVPPRLREIGGKG